MLQTDLQNRHSQNRVRHNNNSREYIFSAETIRQAVQTKYVTERASVLEFFGIRNILETKVSQGTSLLFHTHVEHIITVSATFRPFCYQLGKQEFLGIGNHSRYVQNDSNKNVWHCTFEGVEATSTRYKPIRAEPSTVKPKRTPT